MKLLSSKKVDVNRYELEVEVSAEEFSKAVDKSYLKQKGKIMIPGFRKGKAPRKFIEKYYGEQVFFEDAVNSVYGTSITQAAKEAGVELVNDSVDFDVVKMSIKEGLVYKVKVTVMPEVSVEGYKDIKVKKKAPAKVLVKDIDAKLHEIQKQNARLITCEEGKVENEDIVTIDFSGSIDGKLFDGGTAKGVDLEIGSGQFIPGFEEKLIGHTLNEEFDINVTFPENYHVSDLANKEAVFNIKLNKIQKKELAKIDDEFVKDISEFDNLEDYKKDLKKKLTEEHEQKAEKEYKDEVLDKFLSIIKVEIPNALVRQKCEDLVREFELRLSRQGLSLKDYIAYTGIKMEQLLKNFEPEATKSVKFSLGLMQLAKLENFEITSQDLDAEYENLAKMYSFKVEQAKKLISVENLKHDLLLSKAEKFLVENASK